MKQTHFHRCIQFLAKLLVVLVCLSALQADHLPKEKVALGKPERQLGGITLERTRVAELIRRYGQPTNKRVLPDEEDKTRGECVYEWRIGPVTLSVRTWFRSEGESPVDSIAVETRDLLRRFTTGRGLGLGDSLSTLQRIYGKRYEFGSVQGTDRKFVFLQWRDGTELHVNIDSRGYISRMQLDGSVE